MKDDALYIRHILTCIADVGVYTRDGKERFSSDRMVYDATLRKLQIMAESTQRLSADFKKKVTEIDWAQLAGFRNVLVHDYIGELDSEKLWHIISVRLPELERALKQHQK